MVEVSEFTEDYAKEWDAYVEKSVDSTFYHQLGWKRVIENSLGHKSYYLVAKEDDSIKGILPLFLVNNIFFGKLLVSVPAANYGGICADNEEIKKLLIENVKELSRTLKVDYLELREFQCNDYDLPCDRLHLTFLIALDSSVDLIWYRLDKNVRSSIKKAIRSGLNAKWYFNEWKDEFYDVYFHSMRRLGSPAHSKHFFKIILKEFPNNSCIVSVEYKGRIIASDFIVFFKKNIIPLFSGAYKEFFCLRPNNFISWEEIRYGCENSFEFYDFGRSQWNTGSFDFKRRWGGKPQQLYYYYLNRTSHFPVRNPIDSKWKLYKKIWKRLPTFLARQLGPKIIKYLH